ncbi:hypothetical protein BX616_006185 [Lobosporangium transversale]|uniref:Uncharacterized protein n=1 Tax=Lobosporangium transversale TaxID=64571 RepID=A0A1Y2GKW5_9FUNG|nr:hypothetical protein BCR41DRAFT_387535 [Lobosporangium transversale]KAF9915429.1 hypothetical protein BX616_006185 [Lobosporangium transversale]ORZ12059.1 hypothetical protein BCR41DRAFT_387535 [Lobosporangium transversale]|eukprot:XP_021879924.1 hypothetical protein BCR41DRAFT_387535 [Lobosporangium transversale]
MLSASSKALRVTGVVFAVILTLLLLRVTFRQSSFERRRSRLRIEEPVVVILVHPSPSINKATNFELKRAIARTWAKDVEDFGAAVFFVGEHDGETVMRRPSEFQGRAQSLSSRFGPGSLMAKEGAEAGAGAGTGGGGNGYSKQEPMRKMLIPSVLENGQADNPSGFLKAYHFLYNNTNWHAGPIFQTYPFILTTDTTHYIHVENLVSTLLSSRPRRLLTMKDDTAFTGALSEASECSAENFGDKASPTSSQPSTDEKNSPLDHSHWTLSRTHVVSKQLIAILGPHLRQCIKAAASSTSSASTYSQAGEDFQRCVREWASNPLFWKDGYCGRFSALRYQAPAPDSTLRSWGASPYSVSYASRKERRSTPQEFEEFYQMKQQEHTLVKRESQQDGGSSSSSSDIDSDRMAESEVESTRSEKKPDGPKLQPRGDSFEGNPRRLLQELTSSPSGLQAHWIVASGLTQPEDFKLVYQSLADREEEEEEKEEEILEDIEY